MLSRLVIAFLRLSVNSTVNESIKLGVSFFFFPSRLNDFKEVKQTCVSTYQLEGRFQTSKTVLSNGVVLRIIAMTIVSA